MINEPPTGTHIVIDGQEYVFSAIPSLPAVLYAEVGRKAKVYRLTHSGTHRSFALKVFFHEFRSEVAAQQRVDVTSQLVRRYTTSFPTPDKQRHSGLSIAARTVVIPGQNRELLKRMPDLAYSILMDWLDGESWTNYIIDRTPLTAVQSHRLAKSTAAVLSGIEQREMAHCDLSAGNILLGSDFGRVELVDLEDMYWPGRSSPLPLPAGTDGYVPPDVQRNGLWDATGDRLAGGILLCEILGWRFEDIRQIRGKASFFESQEFGKDTPRYRLMKAHLVEIEPGLGELFERVWRQSPGEAPLLEDWNQCIQISAPIVHCPFCGREVDFDWVVCPHCGRALSADGDYAEEGRTGPDGANGDQAHGSGFPVPTPPTPDLASLSTKRPLPTNIIVLGAVIASFILAGCGLLGVWLLVRPRPTATPIPLATVPHILAFSSARTGDYDIYILDTDHPELVTDLTPNEPGSDLDPAWSPDGKKIVFSSDRTGSYQIFSMSTVGSQVTQLTQNAGPNYHANWSPDGALIAYASPVDGQLHIHLMNLDGSGSRQLTSGPGDEYEPKWSPDGNQILYESNGDGQSLPGTGELYITNSDGSDAYRLVSAVMNVQRANWAPDGQRIIFAAKPDPDGHFQIYLVRPDGSDLRTVYDINSNESYPAYSPDGEVITVVSDRTGHANLFGMESDGSNQSQLTNTAGDNSVPMWQPLSP